MNSIFTWVGHDAHRLCWEGQGWAHSAHSCLPLPLGHFLNLATLPVKGFPGALPQTSFLNRIPFLLELNWANICVFVMRLRFFFKFFLVSPRWVSSPDETGTGSPWPPSLMKLRGCGAPHYRSSCIMLLRVGLKIKAQKHWDIASLSFWEIKALEGNATCSVVSRAPHTPPLCKALGSCYSSSVWCLLTHPSHHYGVMAKETEDGEARQCGQSRQSVAPWCPSLQRCVSHCLSLSLSWLQCLASHEQSAVEGTPSDVPRLVRKSAQLPAALGIHTCCEGVQPELQPGHRSLQWLLPTLEAPANAQWSQGELSWWSPVQTRVLCTEWILMPPSFEMVCFVKINVRISRGCERYWCQLVGGLLFSHL